jgi:hypothetical protein
VVEDDKEEGEAIKGLLLLCEGGANGLTTQGRLEARGA